MGERQSGVVSPEMSNADPGADGILKRLATIQTGGVLHLQPFGDLGDLADVHHAPVSRQNKNQSTIFLHARQGAVRDLGAIKVVRVLHLDVWENRVAFHHRGVSLSALLNWTRNLIEQGLRAEVGGALFDEKAAAPSRDGAIDLTSLVVNPAQRLSIGLTEIGVDGEPQIFRTQPLRGGGQFKLGFKGGQHVKLVGRDP